MSLFHWGESAEHGHAHGTPVEGLDARTKLVVALLLAVWVGLVPRGHEAAIGALAVGLVVVGASAQIPPRVLVTRAAGALPFVIVPGLLRLLTGDFDGSALLALGLRGYTAAMVATLLVSVTPFPALLSAASALGVPDLLVQTTALIYRYLLVLRERASAMAASALARGYGRTTPARFVVGGNMLGALLVRSLDRAERVHRAMLARGYTGRMPLLRPTRMRARDWAAGTLVLTAVAGSLAWMR